jgi:hypothetical protein
MLLRALNSALENYVWKPSVNKPLSSRLFKKTLQIAMHIYKRDLLFFVGEKNIISYMEHSPSCDSKVLQNPLPLMKPYSQEHPTGPYHEQNNTRTWLL